MPKTRTKKQYESHGLLTQNQQHDLVNAIGLGLYFKNNIAHANRISSMCA